jgi:cytochrome c5
MKAVVLLIVTLSLALISCGQSGDTGEKAEMTEKVTSPRPIEVSDSPAADTATDAAEEDAATDITETAPVQVADTVDGAAVYRKSCASCHMTGAAGAPKTGDKAAWSSRIAKGVDALVQSALAGVTGTAMMPKGACATCSDEEIEAAVRYMADQSK